MARAAGTWSQVGNAQLAGLLRIADAPTAILLCLETRRSYRSGGATLGELIDAIGKPTRTLQDALGDLRAAGLVVLEDGVYRGQPEALAGAVDLRRRNTERQSIRRNSSVTSREEDPEKPVMSRVTSGVTSRVTSREEESGNSVTSRVTSVENPVTSGVTSRVTSRETGEETTVQHDDSEPLKDGKDGKEEGRERKTDANAAHSLVPSTSKPVPKKTPETTEWQAMFGAVALAVYGVETGLAGKPLKLTAATAKNLLAMKFQPGDVARIRVWVSENESWRETVLPSDLETAAPRWRSSNASRNPSQTGSFATQSSPEITPNGAPNGANAPNLDSGSIRFDAPEAERNAWLERKFQRARGVLPDDPSNPTTPTNPALSRQEGPA